MIQEALPAEVMMVSMWKMLGEVKKWTNRRDVTIRSSEAGKRRMVTELTRAYHIPCETENGISLYGIEVESDERIMTLKMNVMVGDVIVGFLDPSSGQGRSLIGDPMVMDEGRRVDS